MRIEHDSMGKMQVPENAYYGAQTQRAFENFRVSDLKLPIPTIKALSIIKRSAAIVNHELGFISEEIKNANSH